MSSPTNFNLDDIKLFNGPQNFLKKGKNNDNHNFLFCKKIIRGKQIVCLKKRKHVFLKHWHLSRTI